MGNEFYDINKFPAKEGIIVFPISMSRIDNESQSAKKYWEYIQHINPSKINKSNPNSKVGIVFIYGDFLYLLSNQKANILKKKFMNLIYHHHNSFQNLLKQDPHIIQDAFSYKVWNQFYLDNDKFVYYLEKLKEIYKKDVKFQKYAKEDFDNLKSKKLKFDDLQLEFFLEEHLLCYLISKGQMKLENNFINNHEKWILIAYPGKPLKAHIYLHQLNPFKLENKENKYEDSWYDLNEKKLYDFLKIDLENYD